MDVHMVDRVRGVAPFAAVAIAGSAVLAVPPYAEGARQTWTAIAAFVLVTALAVVLARTAPGGRLAFAAPLLFFVVIAYARDVSGGTSSGLAPLVLVPVLWIVLYGVRAQLWLAVAATGLVFWAPMLLVGSPTYDTQDWRRGLLWSLVVAVVCPPVHRAVQQLREAEQRNSALAGRLSSVLRAATEHSIIATDLQGVITTFSQGAERMLGYAAADLVGSATLERLHVPDEIRERAAELAIAPGFAVLVHDVPPAGADVRVWTYQRADGSTLRVRLAVTRLLDEAGSHVGWIGIASDVSAEEAARQELESAERRWRTLLDHLPDTSVLVVDDTMTFVVAVGAGLQRQGMATVQGRTLHEMAGAQNAAVLEPILRAALAGADGGTEIRSTAGGRTIEVSATGLPPRASRAEALVVAHDVTAARLREDELRQANARFERLFAETPHGTLLLDVHGNVVQANPALCELLLMPLEAVVGRSVAELPGFDGHEPSQLAALLRGELGRTAAERTLRPGEPDEVTVAATVVALTDGEGRVENLLVTVVDVSERKRFEQTLAHLADHDPLTGLGNRRKFDIELTAHLDRCRRYGASGALLMVDLDNFKQVNDTLGHSAGDELIVSVADVLRRRMRTSDVVVRLGGDEFAVLLPGADREASESVARDVVHLVRDQVRVLDGNRSRKVTTSVGVVLIQDPEITPAELLSTADMTMYDAKDAGRDQFVVHDSSEFATPRTAARMAWANRIAAALDDHRFVLHAQPVKDLRSGRITGAELLLRMVDEEGDLVMPGRFLYIAERTGLITDIDTHVVSCAVDVLEQVQAIDPTFSIEVNLSGHSVGNPQLARHITREVQRSGVDPHGLVFEITETAAVSNIETARAFAEQIGALGCRFALDDFGAGFGSFYYLKHLLFDFVKIDGEFVAKAPSNPTDQLILSSIVGIAGGLGKETIAEFVADAEILDVVTRLGVDHAQGYHIGRPAPLPELLQLLRDQQTHHV